MGISELVLAASISTAVEESVVRRAAVRVEKMLLSAGFDAAGYSKGAMPKVIVADCDKHPALDKCSAEGSYSESKREIVIDSGKQMPAGCGLPVLYFEVTRDALHVLGVRGGELEQAIAVARVAEMEEGGLECSGRVTWGTLMDKRMGVH